MGSSDLIPVSVVIVLVDFFVDFGTRLQGRAHA